MDKSNLYCLGRFPKEISYYTITFYGYDKRSSQATNFRGLGWSYGLLTQFLLAEQEKQSGEQVLISDKYIERIEK